MLTKSTFTPDQQSCIEDWLEHYRQGENAKKLEIIDYIVLFDGQEEKNQQMLADWEKRKGYKREE